MNGLVGFTGSGLLDKYEVIRHAELVSAPHVQNERYGLSCEVPKQVRDDVEMNVSCKSYKFVKSWFLDPFNNFFNFAFSVSNP